MGVVTLAGLTLALAYALVARFLVRRGGDPLLAYLVSMTAAVLSAAHWLARPHLFTMLFVVVLLELMVRPQRKLWPLRPAVRDLGQPARRVLLRLHHPRCSTPWASWPKDGWSSAMPGGTGSPGRATISLRRASGLLVSLVNPNGWHLLAHVAGFFGNSAILALTQEFMSPDFHTINGKIFLAVLLAVIGSLALSRRRPPLPTLFILLVNVAFALISQRNIELFALVALPLVALHLDPEWRALPVLRRAKEVFQREHEGAYSGVGAAVAAVLLVCLALAGGRVAGLEVIPARFDPKVFPVAAVAKARAERLQGRMYNNFIWGGYLVHEWPEQRIFIDGATDFYGEELFKDYIRVNSLDPGLARDPRSVEGEHGVDSTGVAPGARAGAGPRWRIWYCDSTATILLPPDTTRPGGRGTESDLSRCGS